MILNARRESKKAKMNVKKKFIKNALSTFYSYFLLLCFITTGSDDEKKNFFRKIREKYFLQVKILSTFWYVQKIVIFYPVDGGKNYMHSPLETRVI